MLGWAVFQTHSPPPNLYLIQNHSLHHPAQRLSVVATLVDIATKITDVDHLQQELEFLRDIFLQHGFGYKVMYNRFCINNVIRQ